MRIDIRVCERTNERTKERMEIREQCLECECVAQRTCAKVMVSACVGAGDRSVTIDDVVYFCIVALV